MDALLSALASAVGVIAAITWQEYQKRSKLQNDVDAAWVEIRKLKGATGAEERREP